MFITFGEILLTPALYDELYYEIIRNQQIINQFCKAGIYFIHALHELC
jgi:hypothetical protein